MKRISKKQKLLLLIPPFLLTVYGLSYILAYELSHYSFSITLYTQWAFFIGLLWSVVVISYIYSDKKIKE